MSRSLAGMGIYLRPASGHASSRSRGAVLYDLSMLHCKTR